MTFVLGIAQTEGTNHDIKEQTNSSLAVSAGVTCFILGSYFQSI